MLSTYHINFTLEYYCKTAKIDTLSMSYLRSDELWVDYDNNSTRVKNIPAFIKWIK